MVEKLICIVCPMGCRLDVDVDDNYKTTGNKCPRGVTYAYEEITAPKRVVTSTVKIEGGIHRRLPVKTERAIPKELIFECMKEINKVEVSSPVKMGDVLIEDILGTGVSLVATRDM